MTQAADRRLEGVSHRYGATVALDNVTIEVPPNIMVGLIGPDGVGKSTMLALISGVRTIQSGRSPSSARPGKTGHFGPSAAALPICRKGSAESLPDTRCLRISTFSAGCLGKGRRSGARRITELLTATALDPFEDRPAGKLSGGMKQKLSLCCALINDPDLLILDEPTTGVDPLSRGQFWDLINTIRARRPQMSVMVATAYMDEAQRFDWLMAMDDGKVIANGKLKELLDKAETDARRGLHCAASGGKARPASKGHRAPARCRRRRSAGDRGRGTDAPVRRFRRRRSCQFPDRAAARFSASSGPTVAASRRP